MHLILLTNKGITLYSETISFWTADRTLVVIAIFVSLFGLLFSVFYNRKTLKMTEEHNKRTTEPHTIKLVNSGFGPALINSVEFTCNGKIYTDFPTLLLENYLDASNNFETNSSSVTDIGAHTLIAIGTNIHLFTRTFKPHFNLHAYIDFLKDVRVQIEYENIYQDVRTMNDQMIE